MNCQSIKLPEKSWLLYNVMLESGVQYVYSTEGAFAAQYPGKPLWLYASDDLDAKKLSLFFEKIDSTTGLITSKRVADICPWPVKASFELAAFYLPDHMTYSPKGRLVFPTSSDIPIISKWMKDFYRQALDKDFIYEENTVKAFIDNKKILCLEINGATIAAMGMLIPLPSYGLCRLNLIYTSPALRGRGFGKDMVAAIAMQAQAYGQLPVLYARTNNKAAMGLYNSLGFVEAGRLIELRF